MKYFLFGAWAMAVLGACNAEVSTKETEAHQNEQAVPVLPSWTNTSARKAIVAFVSAATDTASKDFIPVADRITVFDNDGTLWSEQPFYFQLAYTMDACKAMAPQHPEWKNKEPFKSLLAGDVGKVLHSGEKGLLALVAASHTGMSGEAFNSQVKAWIDTARHPKTGKRYTEMVYQPMLELLQYLRSHGFTTYILSGGGTDFLRAWSESVYGIPPTQVIGSCMKAKYEVKNGKPQITKLADLHFIDDGPGKPVGIWQYIGKRPVFAAGNSDGDYEMLQYTSTNPAHSSLSILIQHTDADREFQYDSLSSVGRLKRGLLDAKSNGWQTVNMKTDWNKIYP